MSTPEENLAVALAFARTAINQGRPAEAVERFVGPTYTQHNPAVADGKDAFIRFAGELVAAFPEIHIEPRRTATEGDLVMVHSEMTGATIVPEDAAAGIEAYALFDAYRFENGRIVEHWDVIQVIPPEAKNQNGAV